MSDPSFLPQALWYVTQGFFVFPMRPNSKGFFSRDTVGVSGENGQLHGGFKAATTDPSQIRQWWTRWPNANIGIDCGRSGLVIVDCDEKDGLHGIDDWYDIRLDTGATEDTWISETPSGGMHVWYKRNGHAVRNSAREVAQGSTFAQPEG